MTVNYSQEFKLGVSVSRRYKVADRTLCFDLISLDGQMLPEWEPGAHLEIDLGGHLRQYSLCGDPVDRSKWVIAILHEQNSRGGSDFAFKELEVGSVLSVTGLRNHFRFTESPRSIFIAGGIGITPLLPMAKKARQIGSDWSLLYLGKSRTQMPFIEELESLDSQRLNVYARNEHPVRFDLGSFLAQPMPQTVLYACGSESLLVAVEEATQMWPSESVRVERFSPREIQHGADHEFEVELTLSGVRLTVPSEKSLLATLEDNGFYIPASCEEGTCGTCLTKVVSGEIDHRDSLMSKADQEKNSAMYVCVSRARGTKIALEL